MVRDAMGEDAIIVATREERGGVRLTAAIEPAFEIGRTGIAEADDWLQYDSEEEEGAVAEELTDALLRHGAPEDVIDQVVACAGVLGVEDSRIAMIAALEQLYNFKPLPSKAYSKALMMVGPPGAGKTLAAAKMAARGTMNGLKVGVITTDTVRAGGVEQLGAFTKLLDINLQKASSPDALSSLLNVMQDFDQVIIDTAGANPFAAEDMKNLARLIGVGDIEPVMVLPAGIDTEESGEMARNFGAVGTHSMIASRVDVARRLGGLLSAAQHGMAFADAAHTPKVADGLLPLSAQTLTRLLMPGSTPAEQTVKARARQ